jgi:hypothetical protein
MVTTIARYSGTNDANEPSLFGRDSLLGSSDQADQVVILVQGLELGGWPAAAGTVKSTVVVPLHPRGSSDVDLVSYCATDRTEPVGGGSARSWCSLCAAVACPAAQARTRRPTSGHRTGIAPRSGLELVENPGLGDDDGADEQVGQWNDPLSGSFHDGDDRLVGAEP